MGYLFGWVCMAVVAVYLVIRKDPDEVAPETLPARIVGAVIILGVMALLGAATYWLLSPYSEAEGGTKMDTTDWLLFIIMGLLAFILKELHTLRTMAQGCEGDLGCRGEGEHTVAEKELIGLKKPAPGALAQ